MCFDGGWFFWLTEFGTMLCVVFDSVISVAGCLFLVTQVQPDLYLLSLLTSLFIGCLINILFNIYLVDGIICEDHMKLLTCLVFSALKNAFVAAAIIVSWPHFEFNQVILAPSVFFFVLQIFFAICIYTTCKKIIQTKEMNSSTPLPEKPAESEIKINKQYPKKRNELDL